LVLDGILFTSDTDKDKKLYSIIEIFELVGNDDSIHIQWSKYPNTGEEKTVVK